jgi:hypothetical protein
MTAGDWIAAPQQHRLEYMSDRVIPSEGAVFQNADCRHFETKAQVQAQ